MDFLPVSRDDIKKRGWEQADFILVTGDAYVDHPSFGAAVISRVLESRGYKVAILTQPDWRDKSSFGVLGKPRLGFLVTSGNIDSMVNNYTSAKKKRSNDLYSPNGESGKRPDRAVIVYCQKIRQLFGDVPIVLGGLESSLRRMAHYDYWDDKVRRSMLIDSQADIIVYGMGERQIIEIAESLDSGLPIKEITFIKGTVYKTKNLSRAGEHLMLPTYDEIVSNKELYAKSFFTQDSNTDHITGQTLVESYGNIYVVQNTPAEPLTTSELDGVYALKYMRAQHPMYDRVPAIEEVKFSIIHNRGCIGNCNFCAIGFHQGRVVQSRSHKSVLAEAEIIISDVDFKGYIHDVGGPTANFRFPACEKQLEKGVCTKKKCLFPKPCENLKIDHSDYLKLLKSLRELQGVKKVFIRSGIRYDYLIHDHNEEFFYELCRHHISGQLKVAPEHISDKVLSKMGKPSADVYKRFSKRFKEINKEIGKEQYLVPYLMSGHPGSDLKAAIELMEYLKGLGYMPEQVQDFYPTPATLSTTMYYTGLDPRTMETVYVPKDPHEKAMQRALMQYGKPHNRKLVEEALSTVTKKTEQHKPIKKKKKTIRNIHKKKND